MNRQRSDVQNVVASYWVNKYEKLKSKGEVEESERTNIGKENFLNQHDDPIMIDSQSDEDGEVVRSLAKKRKIRIDHTNETNIKSECSDNVVIINDDDDDDTEYSETESLEETHDENVSQVKNERKPHSLGIESRKTETRIPEESPIIIFNTPAIHPPNSTSISSIFDSKSLYKTYVFSFELDVDLVVNSFKSSDVETHIIAQNVYNEIHDSQHIVYHDVKSLITEWSCHHSKMVINFHTTGHLQVFISTSNFTLAEYGALGGCFWKSDLLPLLQPNSKNKIQEPFKKDLCDYLLQYKRQEMKNLVKEIQKYSFSSVKASFVSSTPGVSHGEFGYLKFHEHLKNQQLFPTLKEDQHLKILSQVSTIAGPFRYGIKGSSNIFTHILCPLILGQDFPLAPGRDELDNLLTKIEPIILFPTRSELFMAQRGLMGAGCLIYDNVNKRGKSQYDELLKDFFYKRSMAESNKFFVNNHSKIYCTSKDDFATLEWIFIGSMNLSKSAWGYPVAKSKSGNSDSRSLRCNNWEVGVLLDPKTFDEHAKFVPVFDTNKLETVGRRLDGADEKLVPIRLPFKLPPQKYDESDKPWCKFDL
ncbi:hypothetical protein PACTADRAFT_16204 [Pachysolen tannophilus NRRL Y-2460]|uniref:PLD phosphodiesterase domain-containing protein n=1 Tax=Pachysolen tannophilus NRRL Y-2460 TaxID=669874 RepID=A0A1E4TWB7_PACTA|nr:hypothetical protein PACTADRAFT_16204 [Pachysolen tannophilus NRRL Y-2460]